MERVFDMPIKNDKETYKKLLKWEETLITCRQFIGLWVFFNILQINSNRSKQNGLENPDLKQQVNFIEDWKEMKEQRFSLLKS